MELDQKEQEEDAGSCKKISAIVSSFFRDLSPNLKDTWTPSVMVDYIRGEILEHYGLTCWEKTEMYLNELNPSERIERDLPDWIEILHGFCLEYS